MRLFTSLTFVGLGLGLAAFGACADSGDEGILVTKNVAPGTGCMFTGDPNEAFFSEGAWSVHSEQGYLISPQLQSRVTALDGEEQDRTIITTGANIDITFADSTVASMLNLDANVTHFNQPFAVPLAPIVSGTSTVTDSQFTLIPFDVITALFKANPNVGDVGAPVFSTEILTTFTVLGKMSGQDVTSQPFTYGVTLANNVVVQETGDCPAPQTVTILTGDSCNIFQDLPVTCCRNQDSSLNCPAPTM